MPPRARRTAPVTESDIGEPVQNMPRRKRGKNDAAEPTPEQLAKAVRREHLKREVGGIALMLGAVFIAGALFARPAFTSDHARTPAPSSAPSAPACGGPC